MQCDDSRDDYLGTLFSCFSVATKADRVESELLFNKSVEGDFW